LHSSDVDQPAANAPKGWTRRDHPAASAFPPDLINPNSGLRVGSSPARSQPTRSLAEAFAGLLASHNASARRSENSSNYVCRLTPNRVYSSANTIA